MIAKIEDFFMNHLLGKLALSGASALVGFLASGKLGASISLDPKAAASVAVALAQAVVVFVSHFRAPAAAAKVAKDAPDISFVPPK